MSTWSLSSITTPDKSSLNSYCYFVVPFSLGRAVAIGLSDYPDGAKSQAVKLAVDAAAHQDNLFTGKDRLEFRCDAIPSPPDWNASFRQDLAPHLDKWRFTQRTEYFVGDIVETLFTHAKRFTPQAEDPIESWAFSSTTTLCLSKVLILEPNGVCANPGSGEACADLSLRMGFAYFKLSPNKTCSLDQWLTAINEGRYLKVPYADFRDPSPEPVSVRLDGDHNKPKFGFATSAPLGRVLQGHSMLTFPEEFPAEGGGPASTFSIDWPLLPSLETPAQLRHYPDDRAFVVGFHIVNTPSGVFGTSWDDQSPMLKKLWHQILYVESKSSVDSPVTPFEQDWLEERTYERWRTMGTLYGFSNYSACALTNSGWFYPPWYHFQDMYLDLTTVLLYQRCLCFRAASVLSSLTRAWASGKGDSGQKPGRPFAKAFYDLRTKFTQFTNLYWAPLLSNQVQGIEMFSLARKQMDTEELFNEVEREIQITHDFLDQKAGADQNEMVSRLTWWSIGIGLVGLLFAFMGTNFLWISKYSECGVGEVDPRDFTEPVFLSSMLLIVIIVAFVVGLRVFNRHRLLK